MQRHNRYAALVLACCTAFTASAQNDDNSPAKLWNDLSSALPKRSSGGGKERDPRVLMGTVDWQKTTEEMGVLLGRSQSTPVEPYAMYYLATFQFNQGEVEAATGLFSGLKEQFPDHPLVKAKLVDGARSHVDAALEDCKREGDWLKRYPRPTTKSPEIDPSRTVVLSLPKGDVVIGFYSNVAPKHAEQFMKNVKDGVYTNTIVGRVQPDLAVQFGFKETEKGRITPSDPSKGTPPPIPFEFSKASHKRGSVSMMRNLGQPESHGTLFEIYLKEYPAEDFNRTVLGEVISGIEIVEELSRQNRDQFEYPATTTFVKTARVATK